MFTVFVFGFVRLVRKHMLFIDVSNIYTKKYYTLKFAIINTQHTHKNHEPHPYIAKNY